jgi:hypothetical protein
MKFSKQTIFTLLGILVIIGSIPLAIILVKQRQEIRKEAAGQTCGQWCGSHGAQPVGPWCVCGSDQRSSSLDYHGPENSTTDCGSRGCYYGTQKESSPPPAETKITCGSWCGKQGVSSLSPACVCGSGSKNSGYDYFANTGDTSDCGSKTCYAGKPKSSSGDTDATKTCGYWCVSQVGHASDDWCICNGDKTPNPAYEKYSETKTEDCKVSCVSYKPKGEPAQGGSGLPVWGFYNTGKSCSAPKATDTPTPTKKPPTPTPPTPTTKKSCNQTCTEDSQCQTSLKCVTRGSAKYCLNNSCPAETDCTCPGPTPTNTLTPTPTSTLTPTPTSSPTPTPTTTVGCNQSCTNNDGCNGDLICSSGRCRNENCSAETDCNCPGPTSTPTPTPTNGPSSTPTPTATGTPGPTSTPTPTTILAQATPTPVVQLPQAGFAWPTFGAIFGGITFILIASLLFLL